MYYLKCIDGSKSKFNSLNEIFEKLEAEFPNRYCYSRYGRYCYSLLKTENCIVGETFAPRISLIGHFHEYKLNQAVQISDKNDIFARSKYPGQPWSYTKHGNEPYLWLSCVNKYIVLDAFNRVISVEYIVERYKQRYKALHERKGNGRYWVSNRPNGVRRGYKRDRNHQKRLNAHYKPCTLSNELKAITSRDEFDLQCPLRTARKTTAQALNRYGECRWDSIIRCWKDQSKKRKQWM